MLWQNLGYAPSVTDRFSLNVWYFPEDNIIDYKFFLKSDLIQKFFYTPSWMCTVTLLNKN